MLLNSAHFPHVPQNPCPLSLTLSTSLYPCQPGLQTQVFTVEWPQSLSPVSAAGLSPIVLNCTHNATSVLQSIQARIEEKLKQRTLHHYLQGGASIHRTKKRELTLVDYMLHVPCGLLIYIFSFNL